MRESAPLTTSKLPLLGFSVWWGVKGTAIDRSELRSMLVQAGFDHLMPDPQTPKEALRRAIRVWMQQRRADAALLDEDDTDLEPTTKQREMIRTIDGKAARFTTYALIGEDIDFEELGLAYGTKIRIMLEKVPQAEREGGRIPTLMCTTEAAGLIQAQDEAVHFTNALRPLWEEQQQRYTGSDIARNIAAMVTDTPGAYPIRREGGVYFVPADQEPRLRRIKVLIEQLPTESKPPYCVVLPIVDEESARTQLAEAVHTGFLQKLEAVRNDLVDLRAKAKDIRDSTVASRMQKLQSMRDQARVYADLLGMRQETITEMVAGLERDIQALVLPTVNTADPNDF